MSPTYGYSCSACQHEFEEFQSIMADPIKICPKCGKKKVKRLIFAGGAIIFKGKGFHSTDYRSEEYKKSEKKEKDALNPVKKRKIKEKTFDKT